MPGFSPSVSTSVSSKSGDASGGLDSTAPIQYNASFQVGGSGRQTQDQAASQSPGSDSQQALVYAAIGLGVIIVLGIVYSIVKK